MRPVILAVLALGLSPPAWAFADDVPPSVDGHGLRLGREARSLPPWEEAGAKDRGDLGAAARGIRPAVALIGAPGSGIGTAFVISRKHRLLATNAHLADLMAGGGPMRAMLDGVPETYRVDRAWYHPGVLRVSGRSRVDDAPQTILSTDPQAGRVYPYCADLAVLQLAEGGPDLPAEVVLADRDEIRDLFARPIGLVGFPGYNFPSWPEAGKRVAATYQHGMISRATDFHLDPDAAPESLQLLQHSAPNWFGFSGSPIFLPNGHVVGINNSIRGSREQGMTVTISQGVRIDGLWELLAHHKLDGLLASKPGLPSLPLDRFAKPDPGRDRLALASELTRKAESESLGGDHKAAIAHCDEAIRLAPDYPAAYRRRAEARWSLCSDGGRSLSAAEKDRLLDLATADLETALRKGPCPAVLIDLVGIRNYSAGMRKRPDGYRESVALLDRLLAREQLSPEDRGRAYQGRASARWGLGDAAALDDFNRAAELSPDDPSIYEDRAAYFRSSGSPDLADKDLAKARALRIRARTRPST